MGARRSREARPGGRAFVWATGLPQRLRRRGGSRAALCRGRRSRACAPAPRSGGGGAALGLRGARSRCSREAGDRGGAGGTSFAAWDGAFGCIRRSFPLCSDTDTRFHLLLRPGYRGGPGVTAARAPLWVQVLKAAARRLRLALLLWWQKGWPPSLGCPLHPGIPRSAAAARHQLTLVRESFGVSSSSSLSDVFSGPYGICSTALESPPEGGKELELGGPNHFQKKRKIISRSVCRQLLPFV